MMNVHDYEKHLKSSSDDQLIDAFHQAQVDHKTAPDNGRDRALAKIHIAESKMIERFGLGEHMKRYLAKYPES